LPEWLPSSHICFDTDEKPNKPSLKTGKYGKLNQTRVAYKLITRVEGTEANMKKKKRVELVNDLIGERVFSIVVDDKQKPLYH
jgi:hypothetical protein